MPYPIQHHVDIRLEGPVASRRDFLRVLGAGVVGTSLGWTGRVSMAAETLRQQGKRCVLLWMEGGPSQFETLDPKDASGSAASIATAVPGIRLSENLPEIAKIMGDAALIRSLTSKEGSHPRADYLMHHGYLPTGGVKFPSLGANVADQLGNVAAELPSFVRIGGRGKSANKGGLLGVDFDPFVLDDPSRPPRNTVPGTGRERYERRLGLLQRLESDFSKTEGADVVADHRRLIASASEMILSPRMEAFDLTQESAKDREAYGEGRFAQGCLLARRLLEAGVTFVEVSQNGWDTHDDNHAKVAGNCAKVDRPTAQLIRDLKARGMLDTTLVIWMGEFGRTPKVNARGGRDHYPRAFSALLAGCGVQGGAVIGSTDAKGSAVTDRPVTPKDLYQTIYAALGIDPSYENTSQTGRPIKLVDEGEAVMELLG